MTSEQITEYLLCNHCEGRFDRLGENWILKHCFRQDGTFSCYEMLVSSPVLLETKTYRLYSAVLAGLDIEAITYFAASVFWRGGATTWKQLNPPIHIDLRAYQESLRLFLLEEAPFPDNAVITLHVFRPSNIAARTSFTVGSNGRFSFSIPGIRFHLFTAEGFSDYEKRKTFMQLPERVVLVVDDIEADVADSFAHLYNNATPKGILAKKFSDPKKGAPGE